MKYFSMFSGIGGFELGIKQAYENLSKTERVQQRGGTQNSSSAKQSFISAKQLTCIGFSEIDKYASQLLQIKFPNTKNYGDATKIDEHQLPDFDLLVGGFPCQSFSIAGKRKGFDDTRGTLFFDIARILAYKKPKYLLLENVKGLLSHDGGRTFQTIIGVLTDLGYFVEWQVLNSKNFGVPQNRERVFIVGYLGGQPRSKIFPIGESDRVFDPKFTRETQTTHPIRAGYKAGQGGNDFIVESPVVPTLRATDYKRGDNTTVVASRFPPKFLKRNQKNIQGDYSYTVDTAHTGGVMVGTLRTHKDGRGFREVKQGISPTIPARAREDGSGQPVIGILKNNNELIKKNISNALDSNYSKGFDNHGQRSGVLDGMRIRRLTPLECERLQGFPDNWTKDFSDTQRYKMCGNAVTVNVVQYLIEKLYE